MPKEKLYRRFVPVEPVNVPGFEAWLGDMAGKGLFLVDFVSHFGRFTRNEPRNVRYRLEPVGKDEYSSNAERRQLFEENGWSYVAPVGNLYHVFASEDGAAPELHTDPLVQSYTFARLSQRLIWSVIGLAACLAVVAGPGLLIPPGHNLAGQFVLYAKPLDLAVLLLWLFILWQQLANAVRIAKLKKLLKSGIPLDHQMPYRHEKPKKIIKMAFSFVLAALVLIDLVIGATVNVNTRFITGVNYGLPLSELDAGIPVLRLSDLELGNNLQNAGDGSGQNGTFLLDRSMLAPVQCTIMQYGNVNDASGGHPTELITYFYETAYRALARPVYQDKLKSFMLFLNRNQSYRTLESGLLDGAAYSTDNDWQVLVAYKGNKILVMWYIGGGDLTAKLPIIAKVLNG